MALATNPSVHKDLLSTVKSWPPAIYSALPVISAIEPQLNTSSMTDALKEVILILVLCQKLLNLLISLYQPFYPFLCQALAELYVIDGQYEKAFSLYADVSVIETLAKVNVSIGGALGVSWQGFISICSDLLLYVVLFFFCSL